MASGATMASNTMANLNPPTSIVVSRYHEGLHTPGGRRERVYAFQTTSTDTARELAATREWLLSGALGVGRFRCEAVDARGIVVEHGVVGVKVRPVVMVDPTPYASVRRKKFAAQRGHRGGRGHS